MIDEFGQNLEHQAGAKADDDLFVLQALAERAADDDRRVTIMTLQHLAYDEYLGFRDTSARTDWAKVQGRFADIPYIESKSGTYSLIAQTLRPKDGPSNEVLTRATKDAANARRLGLWTGDSG